MTLPLKHIATVVFVDKDNRILIATRPEGKDMAGLWEFPGGKCQEGETPEACVIREAEEELGITTIPRCLAPLTFASHSYENFHAVIYLYVCRNWEGTPVGQEGQTLKWVSPLSLNDYPMPEANNSLKTMVRDFV